MGQAKRQLEMGFLSPGEKYVCKDCFDDYAIQQFIEDEAEYNECSYCGSVSKQKPIAAHIDKVIAFILDGIETEWDDPANGVAWESREGGWIGARVISTDELFLELDFGIENDELFDDIVNSILQQEWCEADPYGDRPYDEWYYDWENFSDQVKHHIRYVFFNIPQQETNGLANNRQPH